MMPFVIVLQYQLTVILINLRFAVKRLDEIFVLLMRILSITGLEQIEDMYHFLAIQHGRLGVERRDNSIVHLT